MLRKTHLTDLRDNEGKAIAVPFDTANKRQKICLRFIGSTMPRRHNVAGRTLNQMLFEILLGHAYNEFSCNQYQVISSTFLHIKIINRMLK